MYFGRMEKISLICYGTSSWPSYQCCKNLSKVFWGTLGEDDSTDVCIEGFDVWTVLFGPFKWLSTDSLV